MVLKLELKRKLERPIDADCISPDEFAKKDMRNLLNLKAFRGSAPLSIGDLLDIEGKVAETPEDTEITLKGDMSLVRRVGEGMSGGKIECLGDVGAHLGSFMRGGEIVVHGNVGAWAGQQMSNGKLLIREDAGDFLGSTLRGDWRGMSGGKIIVNGSAGDEVGEWMAGGSIEIKENVGSLVGTKMQGGTIVVHANAGDRLGAQMGGGIIVVLGKVRRLLPGFNFEEETEGVELDDTKMEGEFLRFSGDMAEGGEGSLYLSKESNERLLET